METETLIKQLIGRIEELENWKANRERNQITYPLDGESLPALTENYVRKVNDNSSDQAKTIAAGVGNTSIASVRYTNTYRGAMSVGEETIEKQAGPTSSLNAQLIIDHQPANASQNSFMYGFRNPLYVLPSGTTISVTSGASTMTDSTKTWTVNELADAMIDIFDSSGVLITTRQITSNTSTVVTIDGTWPSSVTGGGYIVFAPLFLGSADYPWRQIYAGGVDVAGDGSIRRAIRIGYGPTSGAIGIYFGTGSPNGVVTANRGSLFLRTDGDATSTLYTKTSGDGTSSTWSVIT